MTKRIAIGVTGASGIQYAFRLISVLGKRPDIVLDVVFSKAALAVAALESDYQLPSTPAEQKLFLIQELAVSGERLFIHGREDWTAPMASGSNPPNAMVICPASMGTVAAITAGLSDNLIERAADVMLKERRNLIIVPREAPFSAIHLENLYKLAQLGVCVLPPSPGFYHKPQTLDDVIDFTVAKILDQLQIEHVLTPRWGQ